MERLEKTKRKDKELEEWEQTKPFRLDEPLFTHWVAGIVMEQLASFELSLAPHAQKETVCWH